MYTELQIRKRALILLGFVFLLFFLLIIRIGYLTTVRSEELTKRGLRQWTREGIVYARRGDILSADGEVLVTSATAYIVSVNPAKVQNAEEFAAIICPILDLSEEKVIEKVKDKKKSAVILKRQVSRKTADTLRLLSQSKNEKEKNAANALLFDEDVRRLYPKGAFLVQVLGLTNVDSEGQSGVELQYDGLLKGVEGKTIYSVDGHANPIYDSGNIYVEPQNGCTIVLTIDANIQSICEKAMRECYDVNKAQAVHVIVMDVNTGAILAVCSKPDYDPNNPPREQLSALQNLMKIKVITDAYEPGSTFKILTAAAALDCGATMPEENFYCAGKILVDGDTIRCWGNPHGAQSMAEALQNSCNPVFVELALRIGTEKMYDYLHAFGLGAKTNVDLQGEESGIIIPAKSVKRVDLARIGFGQSVAVTPLQLITAACSVVNGGQLMQPYLLKEIYAPDGTLLHRSAPRVTGHPITEQTSATMRNLLELVVSEGGAKNAYIEGYRIGGKTGTAQVYKNGKIVRNVHIGSFLGFAPADDPEIAVLVIVDEADTPVDYGGTTAAPFARQIFADVLPYLGHRKAGEDALVEMPELYGMPLWQARETLFALGLTVLTDGDGETVTNQLPVPGAFVVEGGQVMLYTYTEKAPDAQELICVPDVKGLSAADAASLLRRRGLDMQINGNGVAVSQFPAAGDFVPPETVITVNFDLPNP